MSSFALHTSCSRDRESWLEAPSSDDDDVFESVLALGYETIVIPEKNP